MLAVDDYAVVRLTVLGDGIVNGQNCLEPIVVGYRFYAGNPEVVSQRSR